MRRDVVIVGSGFGGAVMAARLGAQARALGKTVHVIEKGHDLTGRFDPASAGPPMTSSGTRHRQSLDPDYLTELAELHTDREGAYRPGVPSMNVLAGKGVGGGSNLYLGVSLRAPTSVFDRPWRGGRAWPSRYSRAALDPYYARVEEALRVHRLAWTDDEVPHWQLATKRDYVFAEGCARIGAAAAPLKLADADDANEGWWSQGQRFEGRQDLTKNYLADALADGVTFQTGSAVDSIEPLRDGYVVLGTDRRSGVDRAFAIECSVLIVAGGCVQSSALLLRSRDAFEGDRTLSEQVGARLSANGDYGVTGAVGPRYARAVEGFKGKPMSSFCPSFWAEHRFIVIPFYAEPLYLALDRFTTLLPAEDPAALGRGSTGVKTNPDGTKVPGWGPGYMDRLATFGERHLTMGCLALDESEGVIALGDDGVTPTVRWAETHPDTERRWSAAVDTMRRIYGALGGEMYLDGYRKDGTVSTSHPLGGCAMADTRERGVVDANGEVFGNPGLFVIDGATIPGALGVNPSLTIAAVAESIADRLIAGDGLTSLGDRL